jgi:hypothetical protein
MAGPDNQKNNEHAARQTNRTHGCEQRNQINMKTTKYIIAIALLSAGTLLATMSFSPSTGIGFVSEADVRAAYRWQNITNRRADSLSFAVYINDTYACVCSTPGGNFSQTRSVRVYKPLYDATAYSGNHNITGFSLNGYSYIASDPVPYVGQTCSASPNWTGTFSSVQLAGEEMMLMMTTTASTSQPSSQQIWQQFSP